MLSILRETHLVLRQVASNETLPVVLVHALIGEVDERSRDLGIKLFEPGRAALLAPGRQGVSDAAARIEQDRQDLRRRADRDITDVLLVVNIAEVDAIRKFLGKTVHIVATSEDGDVAIDFRSLRDVERLLLVGLDCRLRGTEGVLSGLHVHVRIHVVVVIIVVSEADQRLIAHYVVGEPNRCRRANQG